MLTKRDVVKVVLLSIFTCGIYNLYWCVVTTDELNMALPSDKKEMSGGLNLLLTIVTCGLFNIYWQYRICKRIDELYHTDNWLAPFIIGVLLAGFIETAILQDAINKNE